jgi:hypothetical protein
MRAAKSCTPVTPTAPLPMPLHPTQERLLRYLLALGHGSVTIKVVNGRPVMLEHPLKQVKLDE